MLKPFSQACENNKQAILQILTTVFTHHHTVIEIGSGTGQHACYFAKHLPHLSWQATDRTENIAGINLWIEEAEQSNLPLCLSLDVRDSPWPFQAIEAVFTANTLHIMSLPEINILFSRFNDYLINQATVCIYGPFNYNGQYTSLSNQQFDLFLKSQNPLSGIRDYEQIEKIACSAGLSIVNDYEMPANNRLLILHKNC